MDSVEKFLRDAAAAARTSVDEVLARVLHVEDGALNSLVDNMDAPTKALTLKLDRELRVRNPGLHYVPRAMFVGYRREGRAATPAGERSQIFLSVVRATSRLDVVLPVDPTMVDGHLNARNLRGKGHHGIGDTRISLRDQTDVDRLLTDLDGWLTPAPTS